MAVGFGTNSLWLIRLISRFPVALKAVGKEMLVNYFGPPSPRGHRKPGKLEKKWETRSYTSGYAKDTERIQTLAKRLVFVKQRFLKTGGGSSLCC